MKQYYINKKKEITDGIILSSEEKIVEIYVILFNGNFLKLYMDKKVWVQKFKHLFQLVTEEDFKEKFNLKTKQIK